MNQQIYSVSSRALTPTKKYLQLELTSKGDGEFYAQKRAYVAAKSVGDAEDKFKRAFPEYQITNIAVLTDTEFIN